MRIISGKYKGKKLIGYDITGTRPTMNRVKESLFGIIQNYVKDSICLDLFAGSGSLGLEALSNGAKKCYFVDNNINIIKVLKQNSVDGSIIIKDDYLNALSNFKGKKFDIIFLDPPYKLNLINICLNKINEYDLLNKNGLVVCEYENEEINSNLEIIKEKRYGNKNITIYKK